MNTVLMYLLCFCFLSKEFIKNKCFIYRLIWLLEHIVVNDLYGTDNFNHIIFLWLYSDDFGVCGGVASQ